MHRLIGQWPKFGTQRGDHPTRQVKVALIGITKVLLNRDEFLLANKTVPAAEGLRVLTRILVIVTHVFAHDRSRITGDIEPRLKAILKSHTRCMLGADIRPSGGLTTS